MRSGELTGGGSGGGDAPVDVLFDADVLRAARTRWPEIKLDGRVFWRYLSERLPLGDASQAHPGTAPVEERVACVYLCCACVLGDEAACRAFHQSYAGVIRGAIARIERDPGFVEELSAQFLDKLLVGPEPRLKHYKGRGNLAAWLKVAAARTALDAKRTRVHFEDEAVTSIAEAAASMSPESLLFCRAHAQDVLNALAKATARLLPKQRNLLRMHYADALSIDDIGAVHSVHRATAARWLEQARALVESTVREILAHEHSLDSGEIATLVHGSRDGLEEALRGLLGKAAPDDWEEDEYLVEARRDTEPSPRQESRGR
jgi:RNA polymerase sigma-70 factor (ECF subfamily)